ncbi:hypothetical protein AruPA_07165 [Acidiphilium sp. PA]|uniref:hypothetical protein n=1 Tax=Acidiphilium sp. PA TaxID=2871705 RepID=UPI0022433B3F|nr:hypothetical protein [Acidiphilium sp. PA]MCW8306812.1 hypothetical protein [Acidiphilium sp. PA]
MNQATELFHSHGLLPVIWCGAASEIAGHLLTDRFFVAGSNASFQDMSSDVYKGR